MNEQPPAEEQIIRAWGSLEKADYLAAAKAFVKVRPGRAKEMIIAGIFLMLALLIGTTDSLAKNLPIFPIFCGIMGLFYLLRPLYLPAQLARIFAAADKQEEVHWNFTANYYEVRTRHTQATTQWPGFLRAMISNQAIVLFPTKAMMYIIPLRFLSSTTDLETLVSWIKAAGIPTVDQRKGA